MKIKKFIPNEEAMYVFGSELTRRCTPGAIIYLIGELGAGKTTIVRGILQALGYRGIVKSPTYTLVESYTFDHLVLHHFDLYRLQDPEELQFLGLSDYLTENAICLIEWPERAIHYLPKSTLCCTIEAPKSGIGRWITIEVNNDGTAKLY